MRYVVDAHAILWHLEAERRLGTAAREILSSPSSRLFVPVVVLAEIRYSLRKRRQDDAWPIVMEALENDERVTLMPLVLDLVKRMDLSLEMHDALICASALALGEEGSDQVAVVTKDRQIRDPGLVATVW